MRAGSSLGTRWRCFFVGEEEEEEEDGEYGGGEEADEMCEFEGEGASSTLQGCPVTSGTVAAIADGGCLWRSECGRGVDAVLYRMKSCRMG